MQFVKEPRSATSSRRLRADKLAKWVVTAGGLAIIASILGILAFLLVETAPLASGATVGQWNEHRVAASGRILGVLTGPFQTFFATADDQGVLRVTRREDGSLAKEKDLLAGLDPRPEVVAARTTPSGRGLALLTSTGLVRYQSIEWEERFEGSTRVMDPVLADTVALDLAPDGKPLRAFAITADEDGTVAAVGQLADKRIARIMTEWEESLDSRELVIGDREVYPFGDELAALVAKQNFADVVAVTEDRRLLWWRRLDEPPLVVPFGDGEVSSMGFVFGETAIITGTESGKLVVWFPTRNQGEELRMTRIRELPSMPGAITRIEPSSRNKAVLVSDSGGHVAICYSTTAARDWLATAPVGPVGALAFAPKMDGVLVARADAVLLGSLYYPHPEATPSAYFTSVWYEGDKAPSHTWQSGGGDEFEPKIGIVPLIFGTLKGTIFAMMLSVPLAVLGAMFVSQFLHPDLRKYVKPAIEIMAAMPSVILGFVAALWLAPVLEIGFSAFLLMPLVMPVFVVGVGALWMRLPTKTRNRFPTGFEVVFFAIALVAAIGVCALLNRPVELAVFGGDFPAWVKEVLGVTYEQKNAAVIAIAMSFAVIPIIFTISEDAFSNVPRNLVAGSLALGANRWQTVTRVVLPTASPGIFSATMVGFGRAVGETMIVLMATGNTAIMDWSPFNGFRTLSANIAVEIPEAPVGGTLYRTLFLAALILFVMTFFINTLAEVVRQRLRRRYASL